jgi:hypothetical protein
MAVLCLLALALPPVLLLACDPVGVMVLVEVSVLVLLTVLPETWTAVASAPVVPAA